MVAVIRGENVQTGTTRRPTSTSDYDEIGNQTTNRPVRMRSLETAYSGLESSTREPPRVPAIYDILDRHQHPELIPTSESTADDVL